MSPSEVDRAYQYRAAVRETLDRFAWCLWGLTAEAERFIEAGIMKNDDHWQAARYVLGCTEQDHEQQAAVLPSA